TIILLIHLNTWNLGLRAVSSEYNDYAIDVERLTCTFNDNDTCWIDFQRTSMSAIVHVYLAGVEEAFTKSKDTLSSDTMFYLSVGTFLTSIVQLVLTSIARNEYHDGERYIYILFALSAVILSVVAMFEWLAASQVLVGMHFAFGTSSDLIFPGSIWKRCRPYANLARCHILVNQLDFDQWYENSNLLIQALSVMQTNIQAMFIVYIISAIMCI